MIAPEAWLLLTTLVVGSALLLRKARKEKDRLAKDSLARAESCIATAEELLASAPDDYLRSSVVEGWISRHPRSHSSLLTWDQQPLLPLSTRQRYEAVVQLLSDPRKWAQKRNEQFVESMLSEKAEWFDTRFPHPLTSSQRRAVVVDEDANLVVAGAGAGKSATLLAKLAYLLEHRQERPDDILVLSFNKSVADELKARIPDLGLPLPEVTTFHAKGFEVLGAARGRKPAVSSLSEDDKALERFLQGQFETFLADPERREDFARWWVQLRVDPQDFGDCETPDERLRKERSLGLRTLTGVRVRSQSEIKVADWLTLHGINWSHELRYPHAPPSATRRDYTPDFFLPDHHIWIEVWGCDRTEQNFHPEVDSARYRDGMKWKRALHGECGTPLVEVFQDEIWGPDLGRYLKETLALEGIDFHTLTEEEVRRIIESVKQNSAPFVRLVMTFLRLYRAGGWERDEVVGRASSARDHAFLELFWPFLTAYEDALEGEGKIDFEAMLINAAAEIRNGNYRRTYRYILVDEFQDTSRARLQLIKALRPNAGDCRVFAVGDDWQSIYRFTGSDLSFFTQADEHLGATAQTKLAETFRLESDVAELSTAFVLKNEAQLEKTLAPRSTTEGPPGIAIHVHPPDQEMVVVQRILGELSDTPTVRSVLVLARYNFRLKPLGELKVPDGIELQPLTVHRSKGLEADAVIVLGVDSGILGFPTEIADDRVLRLLLEGIEEMRNAEERRLFYVALTRTRSRVHLLSSAWEMSSFIQELEDEGFADWIDFYGVESDRYRCPRCAGKTVMRREGRYGAFWGCVHGPACRGRLTVCGACNDGVIEPQFRDGEIRDYNCTMCNARTPVCPTCRRGALVARKGKYGPFLGCTEWRSREPGCDFTRNLR